MKENLQNENENEDKYSVANIPYGPFETTLINRIFLYVCFFGIKIFYFTSKIYRFFLPYYCRF